MPPEPSGISDRHQDLQDKAQLWEPFLLVASVLVLVICLFYSYLNLQLPAFSTTWDSNHWRVVNDQEPCQHTAEWTCLKRGDQLLSIDGVSREDFLHSRLQPILDQPGDTVELLFNRDGQQYRGRLLRDSAAKVLIFERLVMAISPLLFWLMGTITVILVRPRDQRWRVLALFYWVTAVLFASGVISFTQQHGASLVTHIAMLLFVPLCLHLHLILPDSIFPALQRWLLPTLYAGSAVAIAWDLASPIAPQILHLVTMAAMVLSILIFARRLMKPNVEPRTHLAHRLMLVGMAFGLLPWIAVPIALYFIGVHALPQMSESLIFAAIAAITLPNWPLSYIYAIYKIEVGKIELRANRALGLYGFWSLFITSFITIFLLISSKWPGAEDHPLLVALVLGTIFVAAAPFLAERFQRRVDQLFGIKMLPYQVISAFAAKIPIAFDREVLRQIIVDEVLPTLMIRQSALYVFASNEHAEERFYQQGFGTADDADDSKQVPLEMMNQLREPTRFASADRPAGWIRLAVPLTNHDECIGVWLLGRRDPDDTYSRQDAEMMGHLANLIAAVLRAQHELAENQRLQDQLIQSQKMEAIGRLSAGVAHDFNNLLSAILGYSDLLLTNEEHEPGAERSYIEGIRDAGEKAANLTNQLLAFSRQQVMTARVVDLNAVVQQLESLLCRVVASDITTVLDLAASDPRVRIDSGQMEQVLLNLAVNASDAMNDNGTLTIGTRMMTCDEEVAIAGPNSLTPGRYVVLTVKDTGSGIDAEIRERIFEPFFTTKNPGRGTGLGLSMVYGIVSQSQGFIAVDCPAGDGTTFSLYLPFVDEDVSEVPGREPEAAAAHHGPETILLVEDEVSVRQVVSEILSSRGYQVLQAEDGFEALELADDHEGMIDLLLTDIMMPRLRGPDLADRLLVREPRLRVMFMSGYSEESPQINGLRGAKLLRKPFSPSTLAREVRALLDAPSAPQAQAQSSANAVDNH